MTQPPYLFPRLGVVYEAFLRQIAEFGLVDAFLRTLATVFVGFFIASIVGIVIGLGMGLNERVELMFDPYVSAMYVAPVSALVPFIIMVGGPTFESRVFVVFLFVVFELIVTTFNGVRTLPEDLANAAKSFGAGRVMIIKSIVIPHTAPYMFAGLRLGIGRAVKGVILAEILIEFTNLGAIVRQWQTLFQVAGVLSITLLLMILGIVLTRVIKTTQNRVIVWEAEVEK